MMKFVSLTPMLYTQELEETIQFYVDNLGFTCIANETEWGWAMLKRGQVEIMFSIPNEQLKFEQPVFTGSFYITIEKVDDLWKALKAKPAIEIAYPIESFDYGMREFAIKDNNGYLLQFGEEINK